MDPAVERSIVAALGHEPPVTDEERAGIAALDVRHAQTLDGLDELVGLSELAIIACNAVDLRPLAAMKRLRHLTVACTPVADLRPLEACDALESVEILFTAAEDLRPLLRLPRLRRARLLGNPWSQDSFHDQRAALWANRGRVPVITEFSNRSDWELTRRMRAAGLALSYAHIDDLRPMLVRPGFGVFRSAEVDWGPATRVGVAHSISLPGQTTELMLKSWAGGPDQDIVPAFDVRPQVVTGDRDAASRWIADSELEPADKAALQTFVDRFRGLTFFRETEGMLDERMEQSDQQVTLPHWLRVLRRTLAGVLPQAAIAVQFDRYDGYCLREDQLTESWHTLALWGYGFDEQRELLQHQAGVYPVGQWVDYWESTLAISLADDDRQIYEFFEQDAAERASEGRSARDGMLPVFLSYASMLGHVIAIKVDGAIVIRAGT